MAKTTRSATATKPQKGKPAGKVKDVKASNKKAGGAKAAAPRAAAKSAPAKKPAAKKAVVKKAVAKKPVAKKVVAKAPAKHVVAKKAVPKPPAKKAAPPKKPVVATKAAKKVGKPITKVAASAKKQPPKVVAKPVSAPVKTAKAAPAAPVAKAAPAKPSAAKQAAPAPAKTVPVTSGQVKHPPLPLTGKVASATARHTTPQKQIAQQSSMNNPATLDNGITREDGRYALPSTTTIDLPKGYRPSNDEEYMNPKHLAYFRNKLRDWRDQLVEESRQTMENLRDEVRDVGDEAERATRETENSLELRTRDRYRKLISKIDKALRRIEEGRYGYCEETDEEIGIDRLDARPIATLSLDAQERREHLQKQMGD